MIELEEIEALRTETERGIIVDAVVPAKTIHPLYYTHKTYYLVLDGAVGQKPCELIFPADSATKVTMLG